MYTAIWLLMIENFRCTDCFFICLIGFSTLILGNIYIDFLFRIEKRGNDNTKKINGGDKK